MPDSPVPDTRRPRTVTAAVWCWLVAAVLMAAFGMLIASVTTAPFFQVAGLILVVVGLAQGYLAGRTRRGFKRFASAGVGLAMASVAFLGVLLVFGGIAVFGILIVAVIMVLLITGSALSQRATSQQWYDGRATA
jgi:FtsH-binding integral membrane protein